MTEKLLKDAVKLAYLVAGSSASKDELVAMAKQIVSDWEGEGHAKKDVM